jgi:hypothetical protein
LLPYKDDSLLGDLTIRFDPKYCQIPNDAKVAEYRARLVIATDSSVEHVVHEGQAEFYLADKLSERVHSFECITDLSNAHSTPLVTMNYPQHVDFYSNDLSVVRAGGPDFEKLFGRLRIDLPRVVRFILEHGECNGKRDSDQALGHQKWRIQIGCCGQAQGGVVNGVNAPKSTYGLGIFDEINDPTERQSIKKMFADVLDCIQDCEDSVELKKLDKARPFNDKKCLERFGAQFRDAIGNVEDAPSERGANLVTKTSMPSEDGGDPKQRYSSSSLLSDGRPKSLYWWLSNNDSESELSLSLEGELLSEETVAATLVTIASTVIAIAS